VLDEPTAVLPPNEVERLFDIVRRLRASGAGVLYVSHRLDEVFDLADRVTVLRGGARVATHDVRDLDKQRLVELMLGAEARADYRADLPGPTGEEPLLSVRGLRGRYLDGVDVAVHPGEVLGIAGLPADGRDELPRLLTDARRDALAGTVRVAGSPAEVELRSWTDRTVALLPPDRAKLGILGPMSVGENVSLSSLARFGSLGRLDRRAERRFALGWIERLGVVTTGPDAPITTLSGGNQQKVLFGRTLAVDPTVLVLCEPTAGVDIGARQAIYELVAEQVRRGLGVVVASSDVGDLTALCTRVIVLHRGRVTTELRGTQLTEHDILHAMEGLERGAPR
jgi:ribose transport system ATP-binding protein